MSIGTEDASAQPDAHGFVAFADLYASRVYKAPDEADEYEFEIETAAAPLAGAPCAETSEQLTVAALRLNLGPHGLEIRADMAWQALRPLSRSNCTVRTRQATSRARL